MVICGWQAARLGSLILCAVGLMTASAQTGSMKPAGGFRNLPVTFEPNRGQAPASARYLARTSQGTVWLSSNRVEFLAPGTSAGESIGFTFHSAAPQSYGEDPGRNGYANYYLGGTKPKIVEHIPLLRRVRYNGIYPGIDLVFHGHDGRLEYDLEFAAHTSADALRIDLDDSESAELQPDGSLVIKKSGQSVRLLAPQAYQSDAGRSVPVTVTYSMLNAYQVGFTVGQHDPEKPLIIDPVVSYAGVMMLPGNSTPLSAIAVDPNGNLTMTGSTYNQDYPVRNGQGPSPSGYEQVYVTKFDSTGENIVYSTYLPSAGFSGASAIAADKDGNIFITGTAGDASFPQTSHALGTNCAQACGGGFVTKLDSTGAIVYSTIIGQVGPMALAIDPDGNAVVAGMANSDSMQMVNAFDAAYLGGYCTSCYSGFFAKLNSTGTAFIYSSYLGAQLYATGVALDSSGNLYVAGPADGVYGPLLPLKDELQSGSGSFFLSKFSPDGKTLLFSTLFGGYVIGPSRDNLSGIRVGQDGAVYIAGNTGSDGFPYTIDAYRHPVGLQVDAQMFALAFDPSLTKLRYSTYLGGGYLTAMTVDSSGNLYAVGSSAVDPVALRSAVVADAVDGDFFLQLDPTGQPVQASGFGGQVATELPNAIALDGAGSIYLAGQVGGAQNPFIPYCAGADPILAGGAFVLSNGLGQCAGTQGLFFAKVDSGSKPQISLSGGLPFLFLHNVGSADLKISSMTFSGGIAKAGGTCGTTISAGHSCILTLSDAAGNLASGSVTIDSNATPAAQTFSFQVDPHASGPAVGDYLYADTSQLHFKPQFAGTTSPAQPLRIWNAGLKSLTINSIKATAYLTQTNNCPATLAPGASCIINLAFDAGSTYQGNSVNIAYDGNPAIDFYIYGPYTLNPTQIMLSQTNPIPFGNETQGNPYLNRTVTVTNVGNGSIAVPQVSVTGDSAFSLTGNTCSGSLSPQQSCVVAMAFSSNATPGQHTASLNFTGTVDQSMEIWGDIVLPQAITPSAWQMVWSPLLVGDSATKDLTLTNTSSSPVTISTLSLTGSQYAATQDYSETDNCVGVPIAGGASCTVHIAFKPQAAGQSNFSLLIDLGTTMNPLNISLSGTGLTALGTSPSSVDFGNKNIVGDTSAPQSLTVKNNTSSSLAFSAAISGPFTFTSQCGTSIAANASCSMAVTYAPTVVGNDTGSLVLTPSGSSAATTVWLYGTSTTGSILSVPGTYTFADTGVHATSNASITLSNVGALPISNLTTALSGANSADFSVVENKCASIAAGAACSISVAFTPADMGARRATLAVTSDASNSPRVVFLTGNGVTPISGATLSPTSLDFGKQDQGTLSAVSTVTLKNSGTATLNISSISSSADFPQTNTCAATLNPGATCQIKVQFSPSQVGSEQGTLTVNDDAPGSPQLVPLTGTGTTPSITIGAAGGGSLTSTVKAGQTAAYSLAVTGTAAFTGTVTLACSGAPQYASCTLDPASLFVQPGSTVPFSAAITTKTTTNVANSGREELFAGAGVLALCFLIRFRRPKWGHGLAPVALLVIGLTCLIACGGSGTGGGGGTGPTTNYTPAGTYHVTVTATSGSVNVAEQLTLVVQ